MTDCAPLRVNDIARAIEQVAPLRWQESYDNAGLQVGDPEATVTGALLCTDVTRAVIDEAVRRGYNMVVSHHPLIFHGLKKLAGRDEVERMVAHAIKHDINIYSAHTNLDNAPMGVSQHMADKLGLSDLEVLEAHDDNGVTIGSGVIGSVIPMPVCDLLRQVKEVFGVRAVRYSGDTSGMVMRAAVCGGAGAFLIDRAREAGAQVYITGDVKYHDFFKADEGIVIADIGHYESEQYTTELFMDIIGKNCPDLPVELAQTERNPVNYLV